MDIAEVQLVGDSVGVPDDAYEPDGIVSLARPLVADTEVQQHTLSYPGDTDFFQFQAHAGSTYWIN